MDISNKSDVEEPEKTEIRELNDDDLDGVNGGRISVPLISPEEPSVYALDDD